MRAVLLAVALVLIAVPAWMLATRWDGAGWNGAAPRVAADQGTRESVDAAASGTAGRTGFSNPSSRDDATAEGPFESADVEEIPGSIDREPRRPASPEEREAFVHAVMEPRRDALASMLDDHYESVLGRLSVEAREQLTDSEHALAWHAAQCEVNYQLAINDVLIREIRAGSLPEATEEGDWEAAGSLSWTCPEGTLGPEPIPFSVRFALRKEDYPSIADARAALAQALGAFRKATASGSTKGK